MPGFELWSDKERKQLQDVMDSGILMRYGFDQLRNGHWKSRELEEAICDRFGCRHAQLVSSGTAALTTALTALGIGYGDEVITPTFTFVASFEAILSVGAVPVFVDVDDTLTLDPDAVRRAITKKTKAIMPVHMCGSMADLNALVSLCQEFELLLLEDACQSIGATYHGKHVGTIGDAGTFSFDFVKTMTCGEGGVVLTNNEKLFVGADGFSDHGHDHLGADRGADLHPFIGYNFRISELHAAVGLAQVKRLDEFLSLQKKNHAIFREALSAVPGVSFRRIPDPKGDSCTFLSWFLPSGDIADAVVKELKEQGILAGNFYWYENNWHYIRRWDHLKNGVTLNSLHPDHRKAVMRHANGDFSASDAWMSRCISTLINIGPAEELIREKAARLAAAVRKVVAGHAQLSH